MQKKLAATGAALGLVAGLASGLPAVALATQAGEVPETSEMEVGLEMVLYKTLIRSAASMIC